MRPPPLPRGLTPLACMACIALLLLLANAGSTHDEKRMPNDASTVEAEAYTESVLFSAADGFLAHGDASTLRRRDRPLLPAATYAAVVANLPIVCVDVALTRQDGRVLLVKRHAEPVKGIYWFPGGRLLLGEGFLEAAVRKVRHEIGVEVTPCARPLGTWSTLFERSSWGDAPTHTVNVLVHAVTTDPRAADATGLPICGDQAGRCAATGAHGYYTWVSLDGEAAGGAANGGAAPGALARYVREGLAALHARGGRCEPAVANPLRAANASRLRERHGGGEGT